LSTPGTGTPKAFSFFSALKVNGSDLPPTSASIVKEIGAGDGNRTHDIQLGKLTFYL
jgi:hypothetical protein